MKTKTISVVSVRFRTVFIPTHKTIALLSLSLISDLCSTLFVPLPSPPYFQILNYSLLSKLIITYVYAQRLRII